MLMRAAHGIARTTRRWRSNGSGYASGAISDRCTKAAARCFGSKLALATIAVASFGIGDGVNQLPTKPCTLVVPATTAATTAATVAEFRTVTASHCSRCGPRHDYHFAPAKYRCCCDGDGGGCEGIGQTE